MVVRSSPAANISDILVLMSGLELPGVGRGLNPLVHVY